MKSKAMKLQIVTGLLLASFCQQPTASEQDRDYLGQLEQAERMSNAANLAGYRYTLVRGGVFGYSEYEVRVGKAAARRVPVSLSSSLSSGNVPSATGSPCRSSFPACVTSWRAVLDTSS